MRTLENLGIIIVIIFGVALAPSHVKVIIAVVGLIILFWPKSKPVEKQPEQPYSVKVIIN